ncbi:MAG TPA: hypothetical protein PL009_07860 [Flavipsychrobacter sp.]|nr:hypothetical protein [Flavipsychrobacter sp.]
MEDKIADYKPDGLFYVNDPTNPNPNSINLPQRRWGYNDLQRRKDDLCMLLSSWCDDNKPKVSRIMVLVNHKPFPLGAH